MKITYNKSEIFRETKCVVCGFYFRAIGHVVRQQEYNVSDSAYFIFLGSDRYTCIGFIYNKG
jgi:hypothetical protein